MTNSSTRLNTAQMARFVARGFLRFDAIVPDDINTQFLQEAGQAPPPGAKPLRALSAILASSGIPEAAPGIPLAQAYPSGSAVRRLLDLPEIRGAVESLVGEDPIFDHHFLHVTLPPAYHDAAGSLNVSQHTHQDSTIDPRAAFDIQIMYYPHDVSRDMGGTRFIPGTHLRKVSEVALARYQNMRGQEHMVCQAGTVLILHHGLWHGGGVNLSDRTRTMFKIRLQASGSQIRQWNLDEAAQASGQRPIFFVKGRRDPESLAAILTTPEPWFEQDTGRLEYVNRIRLWRYLSGDPQFDADYWLTRLENEAGAAA